jgi:DNA-binding NarL/FixJ family response regulator
LRGFEQILAWLDASTGRNPALNASASAREAQPRNSPTCDRGSHVVWRYHAARYVERVEAFEQVAVSPAPLDPLESLTAREREVAALIARGLSNRRIAQQLVIADGTVNIHVSTIREYRWLH